MFNAFKEKADIVQNAITKLNDYLTNLSENCEKELPNFLCLVPRWVVKQYYENVEKKIDEKVKDLKVCFKNLYKCK